MELSLPVKTELFDGPLGLLVFLLKREDIPVRELNITDITGQYLAYLNQMKKMNFDLAGDYLYLTSILVLLKSQAINRETLEPSAAEEDLLSNITSRTELIRRLEQLQLFQQLGQRLWSLPKQNHQVFTRPKASPRGQVTSILRPLNLEKLTMTMIDLIEKEKRRYTTVEKDKFTLGDKIDFLKSTLSVGEEIVFVDLIHLHGDHTTSNTVITLIALLELARLKFVSIFQKDHCGEILIKVLRPLKDFDFIGITALGLEKERSIQ